ncbi:MAG: hypothetical protein OEM01_13795, partial [Desulfobulbaceae bacterium]|nr:hypothetical protein [Desulfobulbaceae bacterium]
MRSEKFNLLTFFFILSTIPLVFGARHALVHGLYSTCILITSGTWLIFNYQKTDSRAFTFNSLAPLLILLYVFLTTVPLPLPVLGFLTPVRTEYLLKAIKAGGLDNVVTSLSYYAPVSMFYVMYGTALVFFYYAIRYCLGSKKNLEITLWIITVVGLFESVYGLLQVTNPALGVLWLPGDMA